MLLADGDRRYVDANPAACLILRLPRESVLQLRIDDLTVPERLPTIQDRWDEFILAGVKAGTHEFLMRDGQRLRVAYSATVGFRNTHHLAIWDLELDPATDESGAARSAVGQQPLSRREREILMHVAMGESDRAIAHDLQISRAAAATQVRRCMGKLGAANRPHAVMLGFGRRDISFSKGAPPPLQRNRHEGIASFTRGGASVRGGFLAGALRRRSRSS